MQINFEEISLCMRMALRGGWDRFSKRVELIELDTEDCRDFTLLLADEQGDLMIFRSHDMSWAENSSLSYKMSRYGCIQRQVLCC